MVSALTEKAKPRRWSLAQFAAASVTLNAPPVVEVETFSPPPVTPEAAEVIELADAHSAVLQSGYWLTAVQIGHLVKLSGSRSSPHPERWRAEQRIFTLHEGDVAYFPAYGLNPEDGYRPLKLMARLIEILTPHKDSWEMARWFQATSDFLYGESPQEILVAEPERVIAAALHEIAQGTRR